MIWHCNFFYYTQNKFKIALKAKVFSIFWRKNCQKVSVYITRKTPPSDPFSEFEGGSFHLHEFPYVFFTQNLWFSKNKGGSFWRYVLMLFHSERSKCYKNEFSAVLMPNICKKSKFSFSGSQLAVRTNFEQFWAPKNCQKLRFFILRGSKCCTNKFWAILSRKNCQKAWIFIWGGRAKCCNTEFSIILRRKNCQKV